MLQQLGNYNDISPKLMEKLEKRIEGFGKTVRYRFDIEQENPDKTFYNGKTIFPSIYTLNPTVFTITDKLEDRAGKSKTKTIALISSHEQNDRGGYDTRFKKIKVPGGMRGILRLELENEEDRAVCMALELHPKLKGGDFADSNRFQVISRVDENAQATTQRAERSAKLMALNAAQGMSDKDLVSFADAMQWDSSQNIEILRNMAEELAEGDAAFFNDLVSGKKIEFQALVRQAQNKGLISFDPAEYKFTWTGNKQIITVLSPTGEKSELEKMAEWLQVGGEKATEVAKKLKSLVNDKKEVVA